jgi:hypothetical protein
MFACWALVNSSGSSCWIGITPKVLGGGWAEAVLAEATPATSTTSSVVLTKSLRIETAPLGAHRANPRAGPEEPL